MEFLISFLAGVFAFVGGVVGNILASDLCGSANGTCSRIIKAAAKRTGDEAHQKRYEEEWLADLAERETVNAKYRHAIGCYFISRKIHRESQKISLYVLYFVPRYGKVLLKFNLSSWLLSVWFAAMGSKIGFIQNNAMRAGVMYYVARFARTAYRDEPKRLPHLIGLAGEALKDKSLKEWPFKVKISRSGKSWDLTDISHLILKEPNVIALLKKKIGGNNPREIAEAIMKPRKKEGEGNGK